MNDSTFPPEPPTYTEEDVFLFLDRLRESAITNMYGAGEYIRIRFPDLTRYESHRHLAKWMETFSERHPNE